MSLPARKELIASTTSRYRLATHTAKVQILDEFTAATGYHRKYAINLLNGKTSLAKSESKSPRKKRYGPHIQSALATLWEVAGRICSKRLVPFIPQLIEVLERHGYLELSCEDKHLLGSISAATVDRILAPKRKQKGRSTTLPGSLLKHQVPIRTFADWDDLKPGFFEADLVAHCGTSMAGSFLHSLVLTDVATGWTECLALPYRDQHTVLAGIRVARERMPLPLLGLDTDNGSEFLNSLLITYCEKESVTFTRSRAYQKNDQCHVEEKNGSVVRKFIGFERFEGFEACRVLARLYEVLRLYVNFFQPSMKLVWKQRAGGKTRKKYDAAKTPCERILADQSVDEKIKEELQRQFDTLDPVRLLEEIHRLQDEFWALAKYTEASIQLPGNSTPVRLLTTELKATGGVHVTAGAAPNQPEEKTKENRTYRKAKRKGRYQRVKHTWRTRKDPFKEVWHEVEAVLKVHPHMEAKRVFTRLQSRHPGRFKDGQLRTMQRRIKEWRLQYVRLVAGQVNRVLETDKRSVRKTLPKNSSLDRLPHNPYTIVHRAMTGIPEWSG